MTASDDLFRGRECFHRRAWREAHAAFVAAEEAGPLDGEDLRKLATCEFMQGSEKGFVSTMERAHHAHQAAGAVAMAKYQQPKIPGFASQLDPKIVQVHSSGYRNPGQLRGGRVLVVGVGNSGADIAMDVVAHHETWLAGKESGHIPFRIESPFGRHIGTRLIPFIGHRVLTLGTPVGRKVRPEFIKMAAPLAGVKPKGLVDAGVVRVGRLSGTEDGLPVLDDGSTLPVENVIWCTGFESALSWLEVGIDGNGDPVHDRGVAADVPGLFFAGRKFQYAATSDTVVGVGRDAAYVTDALVARHRETTVGVRVTG
jgi:putative flavoprotein involved in K+ transport